MKRKRPAPLGVLEFTSALNGEDPHSILQKLRHFVKVVRYQRQVALGVVDDGPQNEDDGNDVDQDEDNASICSLFQENLSTKRQKLNDDTTPAWQMDKNDYRVPFVGTSVAKGDVGSAVVGCWPTGFLEVYQKHSPLGVELVRNDYISALPPNGIHRSLLKGKSDVMISTGKHRQKKNVDEEELTRDQIISLSLQNYYWMALSEWVLGFVPIDVLKRELYWETFNFDDSRKMNPIPQKIKGGKKCAIPSEMMTILMKQRMPEWVDTIITYVIKQNRHNQQMAKTKQQQKQQRKKQDKLSKEEQVLQSKVQQQQADKMNQQQLRWEKTQSRDGILLTCAIVNLRAMCCISMGTAREVLRQLSMANVSTSKHDSAANKSRAKPGVNAKGGSTDCTHWMVQLLQQNSNLNNAASSLEYCNPQIECISLVCTLLETKDFTILSRLSQAPTWSVKQGNSRVGESDGKTDNFGLLYIALRYGMDSTLDGNESFTQSMSRLLRGMREILLPPNKDSYTEGGANENQRSDEFILGAGATADLLSGAILINLTKLTSLAPTFDATLGSVDEILCGKDEYQGLNAIDHLAIEARRLLFVLLCDSDRSPFLNLIRFQDRAHQSEAHLTQLSKALLSLLADRYRGNTMPRTLLRTCLATTPQLVSHVFQGLHLSDPRPNYRTLTSLAFVDSVVSDAPSPQELLYTKEENTITNWLGLDKALSVIVPSCVSKALLGKVVQSSSALLVSSGLKLITTLLRRANEFGSCLAEFSKDDSYESITSDFIHSIYQRVMQHLPQMSLLLSIPTKFDCFEATSSQANAIVVLELCKTIQCYGQLDSSVIETVQFDWVKLLPLDSEVDDKDPLRSFLNTEPCCAVAILQLLNAIARLDCSSSLKMLAPVLSILTTTTVPEVYSAARHLAHLLFEKELFPSNLASSRQLDPEILSCSKYETSLWVDEIDNGLVGEFISFIGDLHRQRVEHKIFVTQAWAKYGKGGVLSEMPPLCVSMLFSFLISKLFQNEADLTSEFSLLLVQMATKMLMYQSDPTPLAAVILHASYGTPQSQHLFKFATAISQNDEDMYHSLKLMHFTSFYSDDEGTIDTLHPTDNSLIALRHCFSLLKYQDVSYDNLYSLLRRILSGLVESQDTDINEIVILVKTASKKNILRSNDVQCIYSFLLAASSSKGYDISSESLTKSTSAIELDLTCAILEFLSSKNTPSLSEIMNNIFQYAMLSIQDRNIDQRDFLLRILLEIIPCVGNSLLNTVLSPEYVFELWRLLSKYAGSDYSTELCFLLEDHLSHLFNASSDTKGQWKVYNAIIEMTPKIFTEECLRITERRASLEKEGERQALCHFLPAVLKYDCSKFTCLSVIISQIERDPVLAEMWGIGHLDLLASAFLLQTQEQPCGIGLTKDLPYGEAISVIGRRLIFLLKHNDSSHISFQDTLHLLQKIHSIEKMPSALPNVLLDFICALEDGSRTESIKDEIYLIELITFVCQKRVEPLLRTQTFLRCCKLLPRLLKSFIRNAQVKVPTSFLPLMLMSHMSCLLKSGTSFDRDTVSSCSNVIDKAVVSCLKYGIVDAEEQYMCSLTGKCLKTVSCILKASLTNNICLVSFTPGQIHSMVISHSSFQKAILDKAYHVKGAHNDVTQQIELIRLLIVCISLDAQNIKVDNATIMTILSAYNASTNKVDRTLRRLLYLYDKHECFKERMLMSSCRWGAVAARQIEDDQDWDWLLNALDNNRIRSTLMQYPVSDSLEPLPDACVEETTAVTNEHASEDNDSFLEDGERYEEIDEENQTYSSSSKTKAITASQTICNEWRGSGEDIRYSPGFILPLVLGALEAHFPLEPDSGNESPKSVNVMHGESENNKDAEDVREKHQAFCSFSRRLCDKGAIALALASLSSRCSSIRKVAVGICGLFLKALQMSEAQGIKSWHERPQLEMVMSSVQRGLSVRRAMQVQKAREAGDGQLLKTPMLPAVSAIFLAKSLLIVSRPGDDMYAQINKYFLRLTDCHGAFQDSFILPSFLSLYCNASDDLNKCKSERNWALLALKDGTVDEFCYRIICQSHIPELIMSALDSGMDNPDFTSEVSLTIDVILSLIQSGGNRAAKHLIHRLGILSWLHGIISWREVSSVFPHAALKCKFLKLITTAVKAYNTIITSEMPFFEIVPLSHVVIQICLSGFTELREEHDTKNAPLLESTCDSLWEIYLSDQQPSQRERPVNFISGQTTIDDMTIILTKFVSYKHLFPKVLASMCNIPFVVKEENYHEHLFIKLSLGYIVAHENPKEEPYPKLAIQVLKRVYELMIKCPHLARDNMILSLIFKSRRQAVLVESGMQVWECLLQDDYQVNK